MKKRVRLMMLFLVFSAAGQAQNFCGLSNISFQPGEKITLKVYYNLGSIFVGAGEATFNTTLEQMKGRPVYHVVGEGRTYGSYDWIFKVRDRYETYVDTANLLPLRFIRNINEGGYKKHEDVTFNQEQHTAVSLKGTHQVPACIQDVISSVFYARNIDFGKYNPGDKIPFAMFLDDEVYNIYIRYMGKEQVSTRYGKFNAIKIKPLLIKGTIFEGGEKMTVWVSDDRNHIPLRINSPITVGSIKVDMIGYQHLRYPLSSMIGRR
ncbi:DUF3108 domain-containing protein [Compostibacter hankyongensis]